MEKEKEEEKKKRRLNLDKKDYLVYCLVSTIKPLKTYVGITNNFKRRIRQHNGEIVGGAKFTKSNRPWVPFIHICGLTQLEALRLEWAIKHRRIKGFNGPKGRIRTIEYLLTLEKFTKKADYTKNLIDVEFKCCWSQEKYLSFCDQKKYSNAPNFIRSFDLIV